MKTEVTRKLKPMPLRKAVALMKKLGARELSEEDFKRDTSLRTALKGTRVRHI